jgi:hypothetical protein
VSRGGIPVNQTDVDVRWLGVAGPRWRRHDAKTPASIHRFQAHLYQTLPGTEFDGALDQPVLHLCQLLGCGASMGVSRCRKTQRDDSGHIPITVAWKGARSPGRCCRKSSWPALRHIWAASRCSVQLGVGPYLPVILVPDPGARSGAVTGENGRRIGKPGCSEASGPGGGVTKRWRPSR